MEQEIHLFNFRQRRSSVLVIKWSFEWTAIQGRTRWMDRQRQGQESAGAERTGAAEGTVSGGRKGGGRAARTGARGWMAGGGSRSRLEYYSAGDS